MFEFPINILMLQIFTGLVLGMVFVLLAIGLSMIFGLLNVVNFAHGAFYMWGAYAGLLFTKWFGSFWIAMIVGPVMVGFVRMVVEYFLIRRLYTGNPDHPLLLTFGLSLIMIEIIRIFFGISDYPFSSPSLLEGTLDFFGIFLFPYYRVFVIGVTSLVIFLLWLFLERTEIGLIIRAGTRNSLMVRALGVDISRIWLFVFGIGTGLAGLAGVLAAPMRGVYPEMGISMLIMCFVVVVLGGMGSLKGAVISGLILGQVVSLTSLFRPELSDIIVFIVMAFVLLIRPSGLSGIRGLVE